MYKGSLPEDHGGKASHVEDFVKGDGSDKCRPLILTNDYRSMPKPEAGIFKNWELCCCSPGD